MDAKAGMPTNKIEDSRPRYLSPNQIGNDPFNWFKDKNVNDIITVKVISTDNKGLMVKPEGCELEFNIKNT